VLASDVLIKSKQGCCGVRLPFPDTEEAKCFTKAGLSALVALSLLFHDSENRAQRNKKQGR
jgi:hypothetical protein